MRISLFWRTFGLVTALIVFSLAATLQLVRVFDRAPPEQQLAWEIASVVNLTRSALVSSQGERRSALLDELARDEGVRIVVPEASDRTEPLDGAEAAAALLKRLHTMLGPRTKLAGKVNGEPGLWVSFEIDGDAYWLVMGTERWTRQAPTPWLLVASLAVALSLLGALAISRLVNRPLAALAGAIGRLSVGEVSERLPETGPSEIADVNRRFNQMAADIDALEADRAVALAGISHDIRTPLTRLRMEIEMAPLHDDDKASMSADIERIDAVVGKFVEYARAAQTVEARHGEAGPVDVAALVSAVCASYRGATESGELEIDVRVAPGLQWSGDPTDLARVLGNLIENALRHGRKPGQPARVALACEGADRGLVILLEDQGPGVPDEELARMLRPFARLDAARGAYVGSGLGLAIVERIARRYHGSCTLARAPGGGLAVRVELGRGDTS